jgi:RNA polymerase sigma factor (sigma-70 family)
MHRIKISTSDAKEKSLFELNYTIYYAMVERVVLNFGISQQDAAEICQDVFLRYHDFHLQICTDKTKFWLLRVAKNCSVDFKRKNKKMTNQISADFESVQNVGWKIQALETENQEATAQKSEFLKSILSKPNFSLLRSFYIEKKNSRRIAEELGLKQSTITKSLSRQRHALSQIMERNFSNKHY